MWWRQPRVFISYRRDDSAVHARALYDQLVDCFGAEGVFFDVETIDYGDEFARIIDERIEACDVVVAVIGPKWATLRDAQGRPRIQADGDYVRREVAAALRMRKQLIPVLIGSAGVPAAEALPADLRGLLARNFLALDDRQIGEGIDRLVDAIRGQRATRVVTWATQRRTAHAIAAGAAVAMLLAAWISLFDFFGLETKTASVTLWLADAISPQPLSDDVRLVVIDDATERALGRSFQRNPAARRDHARLVERLSQAGARTVAFDIFMTAPSAGDDAALARAMVQANSRGTSTVLAAAQMQGDEPVMIPALREAVTAWAMPCIGQRLGYASTVPLASQAAPPPGGEAPRAAVQAKALGLALAAAHPGKAKIGGDTGRVIVAGARAGAIAEFPFSEIERVEGGNACHVGAPGDVVATALYRMAPLEALRAPEHRIGYHEVLALDEAALRRRFEGRTVLVGLQMPGEDVFPVFRGWTREWRHGLELHADATSALLRGAIVRPAGWASQFALMLACALAGSRLRLWSRGGSAWPARAALAAAVLACGVLGVWLCIAHGLLLNLPYALGALALGHWAAGHGASRIGRRAVPWAQPSGQSVAADEATLRTPH
jgi:CHASE2 domain-containing sensor protein